MDELEQLRRITLAETQNEHQERQHAQQQVDELEVFVKSRMSSDAASRYATLKSAHPQKAMQVLLVLAQLIEAKQVTYIDDTHLKMLLAKINPQKSAFKITRN